MHGLACMQRSIGIQLTNPAAVLSRRLSFFSLFPVVLGIGLTWLYAWIFTIAGVYDSASPETQVRGLSAAPWFAPLLLLASVKHTPALPSCCCRCGCLVQKACTTSQSNFNYILSEAPWFRVPYPGQYGSPIFTTTGDHVTVGWAEGWAHTTCTAATLQGCAGLGAALFPTHTQPHHRRPGSASTGVLTMLAAVIPAALESIGDYFAAARLSGAPQPPGEVVSRALAVEATCCAIAGVFGTTSGSTAYAGVSARMLLQLPSSGRGGASGHGGTAWARRGACERLLCVLAGPCRPLA